MSYVIAGIDVHKKMLAVVVADVETRGEHAFQRRRCGAGAAELRRLAEWLTQQQVEEVVMESTAQYWQPVRAAIEPYWRPASGAGTGAAVLHSAQAKSNRGARGRKRDFPDAERLVKRLVSDELTLSFIPDAEQRLWRTVTRRKHQLKRNRVQLQNPGESAVHRSLCLCAVSRAGGAGVRNLVLIRTGN